jgi:hypothetical protein
MDEDGYVTDTYLIDNERNEELSMKALTKVSELLAIKVNRQLSTYMNSLMNAFTENKVGSLRLYQAC